MTKQSEAGPIVLSIAGFDPSGGAGIIADVKTIASLNCRPVAAITSLTFQNGERFFGATHESARSLRAQILPIIEESPIAAIKIGMLPTAEIVQEVARLIRDANLPAPVVDPVLRSSSGYELMEGGALEVFERELIPLACLITPNVPEAETLTGMSIEDESGMRAAAERLRDIGARAVLVKGGHLKQKSEVRGQISEDREAIDILDDDGEIAVFRSAWIDVPTVRGTGCMLSSAVAACLAQGLNLEESIRAAKVYVADAIRSAPHTDTRSNYAGYY